MIYFLFSNFYDSSISYLYKFVAIMYLILSDTIFLPIKVQEPLEAIFILITIFFFFFYK
nr:MAG TPA: hypothetical protein [Caudoviricetes sp.]